MLGLCIPLNEFRLCPRDPSLGPLAISVPLIAPRRSPLASSSGCPAGRPALGLAPWRRGGLRTPARKASRRPQDHPPFGHRPLAKSPLITTSLGLRPALPNGRTECAPPRKRPSALSLGFSTPGDPRWGWPRGGGAGSARPQGTHPASSNVARFWPRPYRRSLGDGDMPWFAPGPSLRTHRVRPSDKSAFNAIPGPSPARPSRLRLAIPRSNCLRCQGLVASLGFHGFPVLTMALSIVRSFLIQAVMATFRGLPC